MWHDDARILQELPEVVYVKFENCTWQLPGTSEQGIYPLVPIKRNWFLDKGRQYPLLGIQRRQIPLVLFFVFMRKVAFVKLRLHTLHMKSMIKETAIVILILDGYVYRNIICTYEVCSKKFHERPSCVWYRRSLCLSI